MMESKILDRLKKFQLGEAETMGLQLEAGDVADSQQACSKSLNGKILGGKTANFTGLQNILRIIWLTEKPFKIFKIGHNLYHFFFESEADKLKIFHGRPWFFDSQYLLLQPWSDEKTLQEVDFSSSPMWIQIWNLPPS